MITQKKGILLISSQVRSAAAMMTRAFHDDPFFSFVLPEPVRRARILSWLFEKTISYGQRYGKVYTNPYLEGIAIWLGPEKTTLEVKGTLLTGLFLFPIKLRWRELERSLRLARSSEQLHKQIISGAHWYLVDLGIEPSKQGQGLGGALLQPVLAQADQDSLACYLDTNNGKNIPFYKHYGFAVAGHVQAMQDGPPTWAMCREPR